MLISKCVFMLAHTVAKNTTLCVELKTGNCPEGHQTVPVVSSHTPCYTVHVVLRECCENHHKVRFSFSFLIANMEACRDWKWLDILKWSTHLLLALLCKKPRANILNSHLFSLGLAPLSHLSPLIIKGIRFDWKETARTNIHLHFPAWSSLSLRLTEIAEEGQTGFSLQHFFIIPLWNIPGDGQFCENRATGIKWNNLALKGTPLLIWVTSHHFPLNLSFWTLTCWVTA